MRMLGWLGVVSIGAVLVLRGAEGADDKRLMPADGELKVLSQKIAALEARLRVLEGVVQVTGPNVKLVSSAGLTIQATTNVAIQSSADVAIQGARVDISGGGNVDIRGGILLLNRGGMPLARLGDPVVVDGKNGVITGGSPTILGK